MCRFRGGGCRAIVTTREENVFFKSFFFGKQKQRFFYQALFIRRGKQAFRGDTAEEKRGLVGTAEEKAHVSVYIAKERAVNKQRSDVKRNWEVIGRSAIQRY